MNLLERLRGTGDEARQILTVDDYLQSINAWGTESQTVQQSLALQNEPIRPNFVGIAQNAHASNGVVFACMLVRQLAFSAVRFRWQRMRDGKGSDLFGTADLGLLETPWPGGTLQDLLARMIQDADLAGNAFIARAGDVGRAGGLDELVRLRPDWVEIVARPRRFNGGVLGWQRVGYMYTEGGKSSGNDPVPLLLDEAAHFAPIPDPLASFRGMSWLTPVIREIEADGLMTRHKRKFFEHGATPNMVIRHEHGADQDKILRFAEKLRQKHAGVENAYKTLHLYPGADLTVVGSHFQQIDFKAVQGAGETRIAAAARVPAVIVGISEGLQGSSLNQGNYASARRAFADGTMHPLWQNAAGSLRSILNDPGRDVRLWYDASDVPFLREDEKDAAAIAFQQAQTIRQLIEAGYTPESAVAALEANNDWRLLVHTGLVSVQLQRPGTTNDTGTPAAITTGDEP